MKMNWIALATACLFGHASAKPLKSNKVLPQIKPGTYTASVIGDAGPYTLVWKIDPDSSYSLRMTSDNGKGTNAHAKGKWFLTEKAFQFYDSKQETSEGWKPFPFDSIPIQEMNDTLLRVMILHNEASFVRKSK